ncbi:uncharacterized protein LOC114533344 [Dendronephthya gigantea]|uniref:uncharacterized protein LOC114533344 n=1 Tax=Dendronephthya gigantea TaxID=151771 RepID=UPI00106B0740|nr:uncharacterized protein LOC114533344 [Dendronephthya gigantea]
MKFTYMKTWVFAAISIRFFIDGSEEFFIAPTAWYYIKSLGETVTFLGLVLSAYPVGALLTGSIVGKLADKFGHIKFIIVMSLFMKVVANLIYAIPFSPYFPLAGRLLSGLVDGSAGVYLGQMILYTPKRHVAQVCIIYDGMFTLGSLFGPTVSVFLTFNINIFGWKIDAGNSPGIVLALIWLVLFVNALWFPKELGTKRVTDDDEEDNSEDNGNDVLDKQYSPQTQRYGSHSTVFLLLYLIVLALFCSTTVTFYVPLLAQEHFHLQFLHVKLLFLVSSLFSMGLFIIFYAAAQYCGETRLLIGAMLMQVSAISMLTYFAFGWDRMFGVYGGYILIPYICLGIPYYSFSLCASLLSKVTDPKDIGFYQGSSFAASHLGFLLSRTVSSFIFNKTRLLWFCFALFLSWTLGIVWFAYEYRNLKRAKMK